MWFPLGFLVPFFFDDMNDKTKASCGHRVNTKALTNGCQAELEFDPLAGREALEFVWEIYEFEDPKVSKRLFELSKTTFNSLTANYRQEVPKLLPVLTCENCLTASQKIDKKSFSFVFKGQSFKAVAGFGLLAATLNKVLSGLN